MSDAREPTVRTPYGEHLASGRRSEQNQPVSDAEARAVVVRSPVAGRVIGLDAVPDPVFAQAMVGPGTAVDPRRASGAAVAPVAGRLVKLHPHAFVVVDGGGRGVLVHLGIDTVGLKGAGFDLLAAEGDQVEAGQPLLRWDPAAVEAGGRSPVCPVVALDVAPERLTGVRESGDVLVGEELFTWS